MQIRLLLIALLLAAGAADAQKPVYRSVMPDGKVVYGDKPAPGAAESKQVNLPPPNISAPTQRTQPAPAQPAGASSDEIRNAQRALDEARAELEAGREPKEGERIGVAGKGGAVNTRLTDAYYERIKRLEGAVAAAQAKLDALQRAGR